MSVTPAWPGADVAEEVTELDPWDVVTIAGMPLPGRCEVQGQLGRKLDVKNAPGKNGATVTDLGHDPAQFEIRVQMWTQRHLDQWEVVQPYIQPRPGKGLPRAFDIAHPALAMYGLKRAYIMRLSLPVRAASGVWEVTISCLEWRPSYGEADATNTPKAADSKVPALFEPSVKDTPSPRSSGAGKKP